MNTEQLSETLTKLNNNLDPKSVGTKSNSEVLLQLEVHMQLTHLPVGGVRETGCRMEAGKSRTSVGPVM